ncbi:MAG: hypothetical protein LBT09_07400, partial [Planctomycetaceae bacterium]|nr:hypothetical protein [Planctomycetaceae bacterium]
NHLDITHNQQGFPESFNVKLYNKDGQIPDPNNPKIKIPINDFLTHGVAQANVTCDYDDENRVEIWPQVYEKAWACVRTDTKKFGAIDGGNAAVVWPFLTGKKVPNDKQIYYELTEKKRR